MHPILQMSDSLSIFFPQKFSGDIVSRDPIIGSGLSDTNIHDPKSISFIYPSWDTIILSHLISQWITPSECNHSTPFKIYSNKRAIVGSPKG